MIELYDYQIKNVKEMEQIFSRANFCFNLSKMGRGKTIVSSHLATQYRHVLVISSASVVNQNWAPFCADKFKHFILMSVDRLRGMKGSKLSHEFLTREDRPLRDPIYEVTAIWRKMCDEGIFIIVDEMQTCKNPNLAAAALGVLLQPILKSKTSRVLFMSGSPIDNCNQINNYFRIIDHAIPNNIMAMDYFKTQFMPQYACAMNTDDNIHESAFRGFYRYYTIDNVQQKEQKDTEKYIKSQLQQIELMKLNIFAQLCKQAMATMNMKVVIGLYFKESIQKLTTILKRYNPAVITGETKHTDRVNHIAAFQRANVLNRLIIANVDVIKEGINLSDEHGEFPRVCYVNNGYVPLHQLIYRLIRVNSRSAAELHIIVARNIDEQALIESQHRKSEVLAEITNCIYPNNFDIIEC